MNSDDELQTRIGEKLLNFKRKPLEKLQAVWRGHLVRKRLTEVQHEYLNIASEIEESSTLAYPWISPLQEFPSAANIKPCSEASVRTPRSECSHNDGVSTARSEDEKLVTCIVKNDEIIPERDDQNGENISNSDSKERLARASGKNPSVRPKQVTISPNDSTSQSEPASRPESRIETSSRSNSVNRSDSDARPESRVGFVNLTNGFSDSPSDSYRKDRAVHSSLRDSVDTRDNTSIWDTTELSPQLNAKDLQGLSAAELEQERKQAVLELYWVQQAIDSRKQYLQFRDQLTQGAA